MSCGRQQKAWEFLGIHWNSLHSEHLPAGAGCGRSGTRCGRDGMRCGAVGIKLRRSPNELRAPAKGIGIHWDSLEVLAF